MKNTFKRFHLKKGWWKTLLVTILCLGVVAGAGFGIASVLKPDEVDDFVTYTSVPLTSFRIGGLDSNGKFMSTDKSIYTKDCFECAGLKIDLDFDFDVNYVVYFYDQDGELLYHTEKLSSNYFGNVFPLAKYARVVVTPKDDNKVTLTEVLKYAKQLKIQVYREQSFKNYTNNLITGWTDSSQIDSDGSITTASAWSTSNRINISNYTKGLIIKAPDNLSSDQYKIAFYDSNETFISIRQINGLSHDSFGSFTYYYINFDSMQTVPSYVRFSVFATGKSDFEFRAC